MHVLEFLSTMSLVMKIIKYILLGTIASQLIGCETTKQAQTDFRNFRKTIQFNLNQPVVYKESYF